MADGSGQPVSAPGFLSQLALQYAGPQALPAIQRSQYLADALNSMRTSPPTLRSAGALGSNLLAEALLRFGQQGSNQDLLKSINAGMGGLMNQAPLPGEADYGGGGAPPAQPEVTPGGPQVAPNASASGGAAPNPSPTPPAAAPSLAAGPGAGAAAAPGGTAAQPPLPPTQPHLQESDFFNKFFLPHEGHINPADANGAPSVYGLNEAANPGVNAKTTLTQAQQIFNDRYFVPSGAPNMPPALAAVHADTYALNPSWANMILKESGGNPSVYMGLRQQVMAHAISTNPALAPYAKAWGNRNNDLSNYMQQVGGSGAASSAPAQPEATPPTAGPTAQPVAPQPNTTPQPFAIQPSQFANLEQMRQMAQQYPQFYMQKYLALRDQLRTQASTPEELEIGRPNDAGQVPVTGKSSGRFYGWQGGPQSGAIVAAGPKMTGAAGGNGFAMVPGTANRPLTDPAERTQWGIAPTDKNAYEVGPGGVQKVAEGPTTTQGPYAPGTVTQTGPTGQQTVTQGPQWGSDVVLKMRGDLQGSDEYKNYTTSNSAWKAMTANAGNPNGMSGYAMRDTFARVINPGAVARVGTIQAINESRGVPEEVKSMALNLGGQGNVSPQLAQQILDATLPFAQQNYQAIARLNANNADLAQRHGMDPRDVTVPLDTEPQRFLVPVPKPGAGAPVNPADPSAAAAELQRRGYKLVNGQWTR